MILEPRDSALRASPVRRSDKRRAIAATGF
jgi:hypothetical protein